MNPGSELTTGGTSAASAWLGMGSCSLPGCFGPNSSVFLEPVWDSRLIRSKAKVDLWAAKLQVKMTLATKTW